MMEHRIENGTLTISLAGRIDSLNADKTGIEIDKARLLEHNSIVLDIEGLEYISSAGLRVILKLRKNEPSLVIVNASPEIYDIFDMTGFTEMINIERAYRTISVDGCREIGHGAKGTVYRYNDDTIVKVYRSPDSLPDIKNERELAKRAFILGIPTAISYDIVKVGDSYGTMFELLNAKSYTQLINEDPDNADRYISEYALLLKQIHNTAVPADSMPDIKLTVNTWMLECRKYLNEDAYLKLQRLIDDVPNTMNMLHCDYHTNNVMSQNGETLLIDMDTLSHGHPIFELANVYITYVGFGEVDPSNVESFLGLPYSTSENVWKKFLLVYLGTDDASKLREVEDKAALLSSVRAIRHFSRRSRGNPDMYKELIDHYCRRIYSLLDIVDTLVF